MFSNRTIYIYTLLKYAKIQIRVFLRLNITGQEMKKEGKKIIIKKEDGEAMRNVIEWSASTMCLLHYLASSFD